VESFFINVIEKLCYTKYFKQVYGSPCISRAPAVSAPLDVCDDGVPRLEKHSRRFLEMHIIYSNEAEFV
jgi:hypothetical protein